MLLSEFSIITLPFRMQTRNDLIAFAAGANVDPITPAFDPRLAIRTVTLLHTANETERAECLAQVLRDGGKAVQLQRIPNLSRFASLRELLGSLFKRMPVAILNISGCDAARSGLALQTALLANLPVCVVEPETDRLHWLSAPPHYLGFNVADRITLDGFLQAHGYFCRSATAWLGDPCEPLDDIASDLAERCLGNPRLIEGLRNSLQLNGDCGIHPVVGSALRHIVDKLSQQGLLEILPDWYVRIPEPEHRAFLTGGWLERWLFREILRIAGPDKLQDAACGLKITTEAGVENELDVAVLGDNALYFAECKGYARPGIGNETLFKLHSLTEQRELNARGLVLSTRAPTAAEALRADNLSILVIGGISLAATRQQIARWLQIG